MGDIRLRENPQAQVAPINLYVKAEKNPGGGVEWALGKHNPPAPGQDPVSLEKDEPGRDIVFHLIATNGLNIDFDTNDPIWANEGSACPPPSRKIDTDELKLVECKANKLTIHDKNNNECTITYQLNFIGADPCDPEIRNGGKTIF